MAICQGSKTTILNRNSMHTVSITDQVMRSLLQKAVRRGNTEMVNSVLQYFLQTVQDKWLRNRLAVITTEECWSYLNEVNYSSLIHHYNQLTTSIKNKDAAGLGSLALAYKEKSYFVPGDAAITEVAELLQQPNAFWEGSKKARLAPETHVVVARAEEAYRKCH